MCLKLLLILALYAVLSAAGQDENQITSILNLLADDEARRVFAMFLSHRQVVDLEPSPTIRRRKSYSIRPRDCFKIPISCLQRFRRT